MKRQTEVSMRKLYQEWLSSGLSKSEFADTKGIIRTTFYYWTKKFSVLEEKNTEERAFQLIDHVPSRNQHVRLIAHIYFPSGVSLELYEGVSSEFVKTLLS